jgi:SRSO17 transposase
VGAKKDGQKSNPGEKHRWERELLHSNTPYHLERTGISVYYLYWIAKLLAHLCNTTLLVLCYDRKMKTLTLPKGSPDPLPELATFLEPFAPLFRRTTTRKSLERYVTGEFPDVPRKNCEAIAQTVANTSLQQLQHLLTDAVWDPLALDEQRVRSLVARSPKEGVLVLEEVGVPKQGKSSVGVQHQYCGALGKQGNCQVVVSTQYVIDEPSTSRPLHWPINAGLYLPESWTQDRTRCQRGHVPETVSFATKPELALPTTCAMS